MNLTEFVDSVATDLGRPYDHLLRENIKVHFIEKRNIFLVRDPNAKGKFPTDALQDLGNLPVEETNDKTLSNGLGTCKLKKTKVAIPEALRIGKLKRGYYFVGEKNKVTQFDFATPEEILLESYRRVQTPRVLYTVINDYIYVLNYSGNSINVRDVFADPRLVYDFGTYKDSDVKSDEDFPVPADLISLIRTEIFKELGIINREPQTTVEPDAERS